METIITAIVLTIGDEILIGQITDTNSKEISEKLSEMGIRTLRKLSIGDEKEAILKTLKELEGQCDIVIITGGLGPTKDDITKTTLAEFFNTELILNEDAFQILSDFFTRRGRELTYLNKTQAYLPACCTYIPNVNGTAPGMWFERNNQILVSLPGVPFEMRALMDNEILPRLKQKFNTPAITHKTIRTVGIGESFLAEKIENWENNLHPSIRLAYLPEAGQVRLRFSILGSDETQNSAIIEDEISKLLPLAGDYIYSLENISLEQRIGELLLENNATVTTAESCTGGSLAAAFTSIAGSSAYFKGSIVAYENAIKSALLHVKPETLEKHGAVSEETIIEMATNARQILNTDFALATSGIAGPGGGTPEKPVGTVWIACADKNGVITRKLQLGGERWLIIRLTVIASINLLRQRLTQKSGLNN